MTPHEAFLVARATARVLADSERTDEIHRVEEITGRAAYQKLLATNRDAFEPLLAARPELCSDQVDYGALRKLPESTLGGAYVGHLDDNALSADYQASVTRHVDDPDVGYLMRRFRQTHDVWHALTGLGTQGHEEVILHAFSYGQLRLPVSVMVVLFGSLKHIVLEKRWLALRHALREAHEIGRSASPLLPVHWERMWEEPLADVRRRLAVRPCTRAFVDG